MDRYRKHKRILVTAVCGFALAFGSFCFIPAADLLQEETRRIMSLCIGIVFWAGMAAAAVLLFASRRAAVQAGIGKQNRAEIYAGEFPVLARICKWKKGLLLFAVFTVGAAFIAAETIHPFLSEWIFFPIVSVTLFFGAFYAVIGRPILKEEGSK